MGSKMGLAFRIIKSNKKNVTVWQTCAISTVQRRKIYGKKNIILLPEFASSRYRYWGEEPFLRASKINVLRNSTQVIALSLFLSKLLSIATHFSFPKKGGNTTIQLKYYHT
jgi:hypothetical protein